MPHPRPAFPDARLDRERLPSLRNALRSRWGRVERVWADTLPSAFDQPCESAAFHEAVPGLAVREVAEPEIFEIFFGHAPSRAPRG